MTTTRQSYYDRVIIKLKRELGEFTRYLDDPNVIEIMLNPNGKLWVQEAGQMAREVGYMPSNQAASFLATVASSLDGVINRENPRINGVLKIDGSRISGQIPPIAENPTFTIRKHANFLVRLDDYVGKGIMTEAEHAFVTSALQDRKNIIVVGGTGSGKTFFAKSLLHEIAFLTPDDRVLTIEDTKELVVSNNNYVSWYTTSTVSLIDLLHEAMRVKPDRIVVGEVRGGEAYQMLKLWNTGHDGGVCTIHANDGPMDGLFRLEQMCAECPEISGLGATWIRRLVANVVDLLMTITLTREGRKIESIVKVVGLSGDDFMIESF